MGHFLHRLCGIGILLLLAGTAQAGVPDCDGVLTDAQKEQRKFCDTHAGCSLVTSIMDSCISVKSFLKALSSESTGPAKVTDGMVTEALEEIGVPKPGVASCTVNFDRSQCRQFLGMEQAPVAAAPVKYTPTPVQEIANEARELRSQYERARLPGDEYRYATNALAFCAQAVRSDSRYEQICGDAQRKVDDCTAYREGWYVRRKAFLARAADTSLADAAQTIARLEMPYCPTTLSEVDPVTPLQAIARRKSELEAPARAPAAAQPQGPGQDIDPSGQWVEAGVSTRWEAKLASPILTMLPEDGDPRTFKRTSQNAYVAVTNADCVMTVKSTSLMEMRCKEDIYTFVPLAEIQRRKLGRIDLTGTWDYLGTKQPFTDLSMIETGLAHDPRKYDGSTKAIKYLQTSQSTYETPFCKLSVVSANSISVTCKSSTVPGVFTRLTEQQIADARRNKPAPAAPAPVVSFSGSWSCDKGNRVQLEDRGNGFVVTGTGASGEFFYESVGGATYQYTMPDGSKSDFVMVDNNTVRPTNSDGWTDICHRD